MYEIRRFSYQLRTPSYVATPAAPPVWTPAEIGADLFLWLDASYASSITLTSGAVSTWADRSSNGNDGTQSTAISRPTVLTANQNGLDVIDFSQGAIDRQYLNLPSFAALTAATAVVMAKRNIDPPVAGQAAGAVIRTGTSASDSHHPYTDGNIYDDFGYGARVTVGNPTPSLASWFMFSLRTAPFDYSFYVNGTVLNTDAAAGGGFSTTPRIAANYIGTPPTYCFDGQIAEIVMLSVLAAAADRQKVEGYLAWKWGVQSILPSGHPYELAPP